jgi:hypothetical protein
MTLSSFLIRIIFLALPGIVGSILYRKLKGKVSLKDWEDVLEILVFSLLSYALYGLGIEILNAIGSLASRLFKRSSTRPFRYLGVSC